MRFTIIFISLLLTGLAFQLKAEDLSIGSDGQSEFWKNLDNSASQNVSAAEEWKNNWPIDKIKRGPNGLAKEKTITYCLIGKKDGANLLDKINNDSLTFESKMQGLPESIAPAVQAAYQSNEANLQSLNQALKDRNQAAKCQ